MKQFLVASSTSAPNCGQSKQRQSESKVSSMDGIAFMADTRPHCRSSSVTMQCCFLFTVLLLARTSAEVYIVTLDGTPTGIKYVEESAEGSSVIRKVFNQSPAARAYSAQLKDQHDRLLKNSFEADTYKKLYSYTHVINGFAVQISAEQADILRGLPGVKKLERDWQMKTMTIHTPEYLGLPSGVWPIDGGATSAGEGVIIGMVDTGIDPTHPSFYAEGSIPYPPLEGFHGKCEVATDVNGSFCNGKIVAAQHFSAAAEAAGAFNSSADFASPLDGDGHGSHTASIVAGNHGIPVIDYGFYFGDASGMAPRARLSVYKALYRQFGGFVADVVAAIDQAAQDGVNILNLSVGPSSPPSSVHSTFLNAFDVALLSAVKAGVFVVQAAGNGGPYPRTMTSFSPWIMSVAAGLDDRNYGNWIYLGNGTKLPGAGLSPATSGDQMYNLVLAEDALQNNTNLLFNPLSCQRPEAFNETLVKGKILMCTYSFSFIYGGSTVKKVSDTAQNLSAVGFVLLTRTSLPGTKFSPVPISIPGIVITNMQDSLSLLNYYNVSIVRDSTGQITSFGAQAKIANGLSPQFGGQPAQVALYSSRGPGVRNFNLEDADILKPNILAPGSMIWAAWSPIGIDEPNFQGQEFAMISGTSMAAPHIAGIAALLMQRHPDWSPAAIASAMMTTASVAANDGSPLLAQSLSGSGAVVSGPATPFDIGSGAINATAAVDPGLIFDAGYQDYINFICSVEGVDPAQVLNATGSSCNFKVGISADLNSPSITISKLSGIQMITRTVTNIASQPEMYVASYVAPTGISMQVQPQSFTVPPGESVSFSVVLRVAASSNGIYTFGALFLRGDLSHVVRIPLAIRS